MFFSLKTSSAEILSEYAETENCGIGSNGVASALAWYPFVDTLIGDDDVFMALELPLDSRSSTTSSNGTSSSSSTAGLAKAMLKAPRPAKPLSSGAPPPAPVHGGIHHHNNSNNPANHSHFHRISYLNPTRWSWCSWFLGLVVIVVVVVQNLLLACPRHLLLENW